MNEKIDVNVKDLKPFTRFLYTIGELPTSYLLSMTYEEQLIWLCHYLKETVIPTVNNNAEAVEEVQNIVMLMQDYINHYFDNLDVQEEINRKLDNMAEDGSLNEIISNYMTPIIESQNERINNINNKVNSVASGSPLVASSISEMTDTTRTYVNTTDGNWYYYTGSEWTIGGTYQATQIAENDILLKQLNQSTKDYINIASDNIKNIGEIKSYSDFNFYQGAFNNTDGYYHKDPYNPNRVVLLAEYPILIPLNKHYKLKVLNDYRMSIYTYTHDNNGYKNEQNITELTSSSDTYYLSGSDNIYIQIRFFRNDTNDVLVENIQNIVSITEVSNINENNKILFGVPGNTEVSNRHLVESSDFEICNNVNILYSKDTQVIKPYWGIVASNDNKMIIEKYFNTNTIIIFKEDQLNYYGINCFANKGALYILQKNQLSGLTLPKQDNYFTVSEVWNNLRVNTSLKIEKNGSNLTLFVQDEVGYTEFFSVNDSNIIGILTSSTSGYHQNLDNAYITSYSYLNFDGLLNRVRNIEETIKNGGSSDTKISRFEDYNSNRTACFWVGK